MPRARSSRRRASRARTGAPARENADCLEQFADLVILFERMAKRELGVDLVVVPAADARAGDVAGSDEVGDDVLGRAKRDADLVRDVLDPDAGISGDADERVGVVREERPTPFSIA